MNFELNNTMTEATRLIGLGDLRQATAVIQQRLRGLDGGSAARESPFRAYHGPRGDDSIEGVFERVNACPPSPDVPPATTADLNAVNTAGLHAATGPRPDAPSGSPSGTQGQFRELTYRNAAGSRSYKLYVPAGESVAPRALIVMLHGCTQNPDDFARGTQMNTLADEHGFLVAYPAQPQSANNSKCWNWFNPADQQRERGEPSLIAGITREIAAQYGADPRRIYVAGFSAGAAMTTVVAAAYPDLYAAAGIHSGLAAGAAHDIPSALAAMRAGSPHNPLPGVPRAATTGALQIPVIVIHGDRDTTVHPRNGEQVLGQWRGDSNAAAAVGTVSESGTGPGGRPYTRRILHGTAERPLLEHWRLHGGGHGWSGGSVAGSHTDPKGPDASREIVRFFGQNAKPVVAAPL